MGYTCSFSNFSYRGGKKDLVKTRSQVLKITSQSRGCVNICQTKCRHVTYDWLKAHRGRCDSSRLTGLQDLK